MPSEIDFIGSYFHRMGIYAESQLFTNIPRIVHDFPSPTQKRYILFEIPFFENLPRKKRASIISLNITIFNN